jgi:hypothetical protein
LRVAAYAALSRGVRSAGSRGFDEGHRAARAGFASAVAHLLLRLNRLGCNKRAKAAAGGTAVPGEEAVGGLGVDASC